MNRIHTKREEDNENKGMIRWEGKERQKEGECGQKTTNKSTLICMSKLPVRSSHTAVRSRPE